jgi:hypothetical protein
MYNVNYISLSQFIHIALLTRKRVLPENKYISFPVKFGEKHVHILKKQNTPN